MKFLIVLTVLVFTSTLALALVLKALNAGALFFITAMVLWACGIVFLYLGLMGRKRGGR